MVRRLVFAAPGELTPADAAYLTALYATGSGAFRPKDGQSPPLDGTRQQAAIAERMAKILSTAQMAAN